MNAKKTPRVKSAGIDIGHSSTKIAIARSLEDIWTWRFPSIVQDAFMVEVWQSEKDPGVVTHDVGGLQLIAGRDIHRYMSRTMVRERPTDPDYIESDEYEALFRTALHYIAKQACMNTAFVIDHLVVGLPLMTIREKASRLKQMTERAHSTFGADGKTPIQVSVVKAEVIVQPQGVITYHTALRGAAPKEGSKQLVMDIGGRTFNWLLTNDLDELDWEKCGGFPVGARRFLNEVAKSMDPSWEGNEDAIIRIDGALRNNHGILRIGETVYDLNAAKVKSCLVFRTAIKELMKDIENPDLFANVHLTGGGALYFKQALNVYAPEFKNVALIESDPLCANVKGYAIIAANRVL